MDVFHYYRDLETLNSAYDLFMSSSQYLSSNEEQREERAMGAERAKDVFDNYMGSQGRNKNLGLYYCFLAWEEVGTQIGWTRRLDKEKTSGGDSSGHKSTSNGNGRGPIVKGSTSSDQTRLNEFGVQFKNSMDNIQSLLSPSQSDKSSIGASKVPIIMRKLTLKRKSSKTKCWRDWRKLWMVPDIH